MAGAVFASVEAGRPSGFGEELGVAGVGAFVATGFAASTGSALLLPASGLAASPGFVVTGLASRAGFAAISADVLAIVAGFVVAETNGAGFALVAGVAVAAAGAMVLAGAKISAGVAGVAAPVPVAALVVAVLTVPALFLPPVGGEPPALRVVMEILLRKINANSASSWHLNDHELLTKHERRVPGAPPHIWRCVSFVT